MPGPWASVGVQANAPVAGSMLAPLGAPASRLQVKVSPSESVAVAVKVSGDSSLMVLFAMAATTGALLTSFTVTVKVCVALFGGCPSSVTRTVML